MPTIIICQGAFMLPSSHLPPIARPSRRSTLWIGLLCLLVALALFVALVRPAFAQKTLSTSEAKDHIGEMATVCGTVVSTRYAATTKGRPTFLNLDKPYPNQIFTVVIWGSDRDKFGKPE